MKKNNFLKKVASSELANFIGRNFNVDFAVEKIKQHFNNNGKDVAMLQEKDFSTFKSWLNSMSVDVAPKPQDNRTATEILNSIGYDLIYTKTASEASKFKKFFAKNELLCKFDSNSRFTNSKVFFIVNRNAKNIKRSENPQRQDEYSTSVMSMSISSDGRNLLQITSRYNHSVSGCDNTYGSNLDSIHEGLTNALNKEFNFRIKEKANQFEFDNFVEIDGVFIYYHTEIDGVKIGNNTLVHDTVVNFSFDRYYTYSYYIIDLKECKIVWDNINTVDSFVDYFNNTVKKVVFVKDIHNVDDLDSDEICYIQK